MKTTASTNSAAIAFIAAGTGRRRGFGGAGAGASRGSATGTSALIGRVIREATLLGPGACGQADSTEVADTRSATRAQPWLVGQLSWWRTG